MPPLSLYHRTLCEVLYDMRSCYKTLNFAPMLALIEEAQVLGNKMEAGLYNQKDFIRAEKKHKKLKKEIKEMKKQLDK